MAASYPTTVKTWTPVVDNVDDIMAADVNEAYDEIIAIENELNLTKYPTNTKATPIDADSMIVVDSEATNSLKRSTWANIKATLKTYFDTLYNKYVHPNHSGDVTSVADGATTIANGVVTNAKLSSMIAYTIKGRKTNSTGAPEDLSTTELRTLINVADGSNNYVHPTTDGNLHVPATSTTNNGKVLTAGSTAGALTWNTPSSTAAAISIADSGGKFTATDVEGALAETADIVSSKLTKFVGTTAGTATALTCTIANATLADFTNIQVRLHADLGASATLNLNGLGAIPIYTSGNVAVGTGALTGSMLNLMYNSTLSRWYLLDILSAPASYEANMIKFFAIPSSTGKIRLKIEKPTDATGVMLRYKTTAWTSGDTKDTGTLIASVTDDSTYKGNNQWYEVSGLTNGTSYHIKAFPYKDSAYNQAIGTNETLCTAGGLHAEYTADSISGSTVNDTSGNSFNATIIQNVTSATGKVGNALNTTTHTGQVTLPNNVSSSNTTPQGYCFWFKATEISVRNILVYIMYNTKLQVEFTSDNKLRVQYSNSPDLAVTTVNTLSANTLYFVVVKYTGTQIIIKFFSETALIETIAGTATPQTNTDANLLFHPAVGLKGFLDQVRLFSRATTDAEDLALWNGGAGC